MTVRTKHPWTQRSLQRSLTALATGLSLSLLPAAPFPDGSLVTLTANLSGVSTWPGYRRPTLISDIDVQGGRVAFAGAGLGALVLDRNSGSVVRRYVSPTIGSSGNDVALAGNACLMEDDVSFPSGQWFGLGSPLVGAGEFESEIGFGVAGLGGLGLSWTMSFHRTNTFIRTYDASSPTGPVVTGQWELLHADNLTPSDIQLCEVDGRKMAVVRRIAGTSPTSAHWLEVMSLDPDRPIQSATLNLPSTDNRLRVAPDGRFLLLDYQSDEDWIRLYRVELNGNAASFRQLSETKVQDLDSTTPALGNNLMASLVSHPSEEAVVLHDVSDPAAPVRLATLALPVQERLGNSAYLALEADRLLFADSRGAYRNADLSDPSQPRWLGESLLTGITDSLTHNGPWVLADEGISDAVRLLDLGADATDPSEVATVVLEQGAQSVAWVGHMAYVLEASGGASLLAIDFSVPRQPRLARQPLSGSILSDYSLATDGEVLVVRNGDVRFSHLLIYTLETPGYPRQVARIPVDSSGAAFVGDVVVRDGIAYAQLDPVSGDSLLLTLDLRDPAVPKELARIAIPSTGTMHLEGSRLRILSYRFQHWLHQVHELDVSNPAQPVLQGTAQDPDDGSQGEYSIATDDFLLRTVHGDGQTPWGAVGHTVLRADQLRHTETGIEFGEKHAEMLLRRFSVKSTGNTRTTEGRRHSLNTPHRIGDLILLPVGQHGFDIIRADFLPATAPTLVHPPVGRTVAAGRRAVLSATVDGALPLTMQWFKEDRALTNGGPVSGVNSPALVLDPVSPEDAGDYRLQVTNPAGEVSSEPVSLTVVAARPLRLELASAGGTNWKATFSGDPGQVVQLEQSDDLKTWTAVEVSSDAIRAWLTEGEEESSIFSTGSAEARYYRATVDYSP